MRVIIDSNVLVSAVLRDRDPERVVLHVAAQPDPLVERFGQLVADQRVCRVAFGIL